MAIFQSKIQKIMLFLAFILPLPALAQNDADNAADAAATPSWASPNDLNHRAVAGFIKSKEKSSPVMIIRFNQKNVYFQNPIRRIVGKIDETKPAAKYELLSIAPAGKNRNPANDKDFDENVKSVIAVLSRFQVPVENITVRKETSSTIENQEVHIFVE